MALTNKLTAVADAIRNKTGSTALLTLDEMPTAINGIIGGEGGSLYDYIPEEAFYFTGDSKYKFAYKTWDWFIEKYGDMITTEDLKDMTRMFEGSLVEKIKFTINGTMIDDYPMNYMFYNCIYLNELPTVIAYPDSISYLFSYCRSLREIPDDWADGINWERLHSYASANMTNMFANCYSLRKIPDSLIQNLWGIQVSYLYSVYNGAFNSCYTLDEILNLKVLDVTITANHFSKTFAHTYRLKNMTFETEENVKIANWKNQTIDLSSYVGYGITGVVCSFNSGITTDKEVTDDTTYQRLKDDPDWFTLKKEYSRYNHDSAVTTINSLPDTSAYLATAGGTNTIKFLGASGSATDSGAINTLTEEEIAVATAKGWTVTLV